MNTMGISSAQITGAPEAETQQQYATKKYQIDANTSQNFLQQFMALLNSIELKCPQCGESTPLAADTGYPAQTTSPLYASGMQLSGSWNGLPISQTAGALTGLGTPLQGMDVEWSGGKDPSLWQETVQMSNARVETSTFDYLRPGQMSKVTKNIAEEGEPAPGERVGFLITGISRDPAFANVQARSNIAWTRWPG